MFFQKHLKAIQKASNLYYWKWWVADPQFFSKFNQIFLQHTGSSLLVRSSSLPWGSSRGDNTSGCITLWKGISKYATIQHSNSWFSHNFSSQPQSFRSWKPKDVGSMTGKNILIYHIILYIRYFEMWYHGRQGHLNWTLIYANTENSCEPP